MAADQNCCSTASPILPFTFWIQVQIHCSIHLTDINLGYVKSLLLTVPVDGDCPPPACVPPPVGGEAAPPCDGVLLAFPTPSCNATEPPYPAGGIIISLPPPVKNEALKRKILIGSKLNCCMEGHGGDGVGGLLSPAPTNPIVVWHIQLASLIAEQEAVLSREVRK